MLNKKLRMEIACMTPSYDDPPPTSRMEPPLRPMDEELYPLDEESLKHAGTERTAEEGREWATKLGEALREWHTVGELARQTGASGVWVQGQLSWMMRANRIERKPAATAGKRALPRWLYRRKE